LADYPEFAATESYKSYDVTLKIEKPDGTLIYEGTAQKVSSGKTKYLPLADFEKEKPADKQDTPPENNITEKDNENKSSFSPIFLVPIGAALIIVVFCALFLRRRK
jgi:hypothetical protein